jgi:hypothetical protein
LGTGRRRESYENSERLSNPANACMHWRLLRNLLVDNRPKTGKETTWTAHNDKCGGETANRNAKHDSRSRRDENKSRPTYNIIDPSPAYTTPRRGNTMHSSVFQEGYTSFARKPRKMFMCLSDVWWAVQCLWMQVLPPRYMSRCAIKFDIK